MKLPNGTPFQQRVWREIKKIPAGQTRTYKEIAEAAGHPGSYRAVGQACKKNPLPVIVPCHRVICSNGSLGGYSRGRKLKKRLLAMEKRGKI